jgi:hypothetical protein
MECGSAMHARVLTPDTWKNQWHFYEKARNERHVEYREFLLERKTSPDFVLTAKDFAFVEQYGGALRSEPWMQPFLAGQVEVPIAWVDPESGLPCKAKPDAAPNPKLLVDLKTLPELTERAIRNRFAEHLLPLQAAHYMDGWSIVNGFGPIDWDAEEPTDIQFVWVFVPNTPPADEASTRMAFMDDLRRAGHLRRKLLTKIAECHRANNWPKTNPLPTFVGVPEYAFQMTAQ